MYTEWSVTHYSYRKSKVALPNARITEIHQISKKCNGILQCENAVCTFSKRPPCKITERWLAAIIEMKCRNCHSAMKYTTCDARMRVDILQGIELFLILQVPQGLFLGIVDSMTTPAHI